jgi:hypothetical protein
MIYAQPDPTNPDDDSEQRRMQVMQALLQQRGGGAGVLPALAQVAQGVAQQRMQQNGVERRQNRGMGLTETAPAFDDQGYSLPRAPGMQQPNAWQAISNWFNRGD